MQNKPKISVIIPVYNTQNYLRECLDSVTNQTLTDIEILCINDGSTDNSQMILEEYAKKDERIKVFTQENKGAAATRNKGIMEAQGEYLSFIDADDYIDITTYSKTYKIATDNNSDVVIFNTECIFTNEEQYYQRSGFDTTRYFQGKEIPAIFTYREIKEHILKICWNIWNKIYKTEFIKQNKIKFFEELTFAEDIPFHAEVIVKADKLSFLDEKLYKYRINVPASLTKRTQKLNETKNIFKTINKIKDILLETHTYIELAGNYANFSIVLLRSYLYEIEDFNIENEFLKKFKTHIKHFGENEIAGLSDENRKTYDFIKSLGSCSDEYLCAEYEKRLKQLTINDLNISQKAGKYYTKRIKIHKTQKKIFFTLWVITTLILAVFIFTR